ncbi:hypothetical protein GEV29_09865 [Aeromicrobium sp. SMF47]|uniref:Uncharacterized protein n=1 Tax=Aeromicrobium yanjiei TaxID=2662028 RepID=A0A5Q2MFU7_9ACTN|nr:MULTISPECIES: hypothetical protein [Aeromicrobium]MRJ76842.1 hypothetical protein [Aeromicrobium yanjiei]MRK01186.1 hypothetical protein [Aeromicrobium sp. S22]QGG42024.1 hypothetical protein GEV26_11955 [Aeromicrobium yanjiei]
MVTIAELLTWESASLDTAADGLYRTRRDLVDLQDEVDDSRVPLSWQGDAATAASQQHAALVDRLRDATAEVAKVAASLDLAGSDIAAARKDLEGAMDTASKHGFTVDTTSGEVTDPKTYDDESIFERMSEEITLTAVAAQISAALTKAAEADADLARAMTAAANGTIDGGNGSLGDAGDQLPAGLDGMTPEEIAAKYGEDVVIDSLRAWLGVEAELATWEIEGYAEAQYQVMGDGKVVMALTLEAGLGREIEVAGAEVDASAGGTTTLELTFKDQAEADAFLDGLDDAASDLGLTDMGNVPGAVASNVANYVMDQDITSFRTGVYGKVGTEFDTAVAQGEAEGRMDGYYDWVSEQYGITIAASADASLGGQDSGLSGSASLSGDIKFDGDGMSSAVLEGRISGALANDKLDVNLPASTSTGQAVDVRLTMDEDNPKFDEFKSAIASGDVDRAVDIAYSDADVVVRSTTLETYASEEHEVDIKVAELEVEYGAEGELANRIWVREGGQGYWVDIDPEAARR